MVLESEGFEFNYCLTWTQNLQTRFQVNESESVINLEISYLKQFITY